MKSHHPLFDFSSRHIGPRKKQIHQMLSEMGFKNLEGFLKQLVPEEIQNIKSLNLPPPLTEEECVSQLQKQAEKNQIFKSYMGCGYHETHTPAVIQRNILENPVWLTPYTPYQSELAQGRLEALLNFQTMICELTGMDISTSSLLDEATALAEALSLSYHNRENQKSSHLLVDECLFPQNVSVLKTRAESMGLKVTLACPFKTPLSERFFALMVQYPGSDGKVNDYEVLFQQAKKKGIKTVMSADPLALCLLKTPKAQGADIVTGSCQRLGTPLWFGGPHTAYLATHKKYIRSLPGRIAGVSKDRARQPALRLTLQTREQHIRRERATSNICTAQALLSVVSSMYAIYHGPERLKAIAERVHLLALSFVKSLKALSFKIKHTQIFDTVQTVLSPQKNSALYQKLLQNRINVLKFSEQCLSVSFNETHKLKDVQNLIRVFLPFAPAVKNSKTPLLKEVQSTWLSSSLMRNSPCLKHPVFKTYHSETALLRYIHHLGSKDLSLTHSLIPLGSCTMKLNATSELLPLSWRGFKDIHPFAPSSQTRGYLQIVRELESYLCKITGFDAVSFQPNAGSQGEYTGLVMIRKYHEEKGQRERSICLIPTSAHGTNPASAIQAGFKVLPLKCQANGSLCEKDLKHKLKEYGSKTAALMITYPSTYGVFDKNIHQVCRLVHQAGALVYLDGANMNALMGISHLNLLGADLCHLNLHKTFCIPHGGGGPGMGPVVVSKKLKHLLPTHPLLSRESKGWSVSAAPYGSAGLLPISWAYIRLMGSEGLKKATQCALLNANYLAHRLKKHYSVLYTDSRGFVAHECILDFRKFRYSAEVTVEDVAKRLMDYGFHAPTVSWPVPHTLMVEPTESEDKGEIDRLSEALIQIRREIQEIEEKKYPLNNNVLKNAPHTLNDATQDKWPFPYSKEKAFYPLPFVRKNKFLPPVSRVENAYGDIQPFCACPPVTDSENKASEHFLNSLKESRQV